VLKKEIILSRFHILSGGEEHPSDMLPEGTQIDYCSDINYVFHPNQITAFTLLGETNKEGTLNVNYPEGKEPTVKAIRIKINQTSKYWLYITEMFIGKK